MPDFVVLDLTREEVVDLFEASSRDDWKRALSPYLRAADDATLRKICDRIPMLLLEWVLPEAVAEAVFDQHAELPF